MLVEPERKRSKRVTIQMNGRSMGTSLELKDARKNVQLGGGLAPDFNLPHILRQATIAPALYVYAGAKAGVSEWEASESGLTLTG